MTGPLISVIIPIYQVEQYLDQCIQSVVNQTYQTLEIILVDDGSPDRCGQICDRYAQQDPRITVIHQKNGGLSAARNAGIEQAHGTYLAFVDSDDYIRATMLEHLYQGLCQTNSDMAICGVQSVDALGNAISPPKKISVQTTWDEIQFWEFFYQDNIWLVTAWNKLYHRRLFETTRFPHGLVYEDNYILHELVGLCHSICCIPSVEYFYLHRTGSISHSSFSEKELPIAEALIRRIDYFYKKGYIPIAQSAALDTSHSMCTMFPHIKELSLEMKQHYRSLYHQLCTVYHKLLWEQFSFRYALYGLLFTLHPGPYHLLRQAMKLLPVPIYQQVRTHFKK